MSGWTPGPWRFEDEDGECVYQDVGPEKSGYHIARATPVIDTPTTVANAHLIAAAPDLYAALEKARETLCRALLVANNSRGWSPESHVRVQAIDAALRKARGE